MKPMYNTPEKTREEIAECLTMSTGYATGYTQKSAYRITPEEGGFRLTLIAQTKNIDVRAVTIPLGTFDSVADILSSYPEIAECLTWVPQA